MDGPRLLTGRHRSRDGAEHDTVTLTTAWQVGQKRVDSASRLFLPLPDCLPSLPHPFALLAASSTAKASYCSSHWTDGRDSHFQAAFSSLPPLNPLSWLASFLPSNVLSLRCSDLSRSLLTTTRESAYRITRICATEQRGEKAFLLMVLLCLVWYFPCISRLQRASTSSLDESLASLRQ